MRFGPPGVTPAGAGPPPRAADHEILKAIGTGSYGGVWLARSAAGQLRAVKVVWRSRFSSDRPYEREFNGMRQFEPISRSHPGVVHILHVGRDDAAGYFYYVMELAEPLHAAGRQEAEAIGVEDGVDGDGGLSAAPFANYEPRTLASELKARGRLAQVEVLALGVQLAGALDHIHRHRLVHRDVKPSNVIFVDGQAKLADIGLVTGADEARSFVGTEGFIPPEGPGSTQADIFGLGRLLYEAATGKDRCDFPDLPEDLDAWPDSERGGLLELNEILARACAPAPSQRHANAAELAGDLNVLLAGRSIRRAYGVEHRLRRATQVIGIAVLTALVALGAFWFQQAQRRLAETRAGEEAALRSRAEAAESVAREQLRTSLLNQARALTNSGEMDRRTRALAALGDAARIRPGIDLRNAVIAALAAPEMRVVRRWNPATSGSVPLRPDRSLKRYISQNSDGSITVHAIDDDREFFRLPRVAAVSNAAAAADLGLFSPDGSWLAVKYHDNTLRVWNLSSRASREVVQDVASGAFAFTPDSRRLIANSLGGHVHLFDLASGRETGRRTIGDLKSILAIHPTEPLFLVADYGRPTIEIRRVEDGSLVRRLDVPEMGLEAVWSADGKSLIAAHRDYAVRVWDWPSMGGARGGARGEAPRLVLRYHRAEPTFLGTDPSGRWLVTSGWDTQSFVVDLHDGRMLLNQAADRIFPAVDRPAFLLITDGDWRLVEVEPAFAFDEIAIHAKDKSPRDVCFSPDGRWLATGGPDGVRILDWKSREAIDVLDDEVTLRVAFSADPARLCAVTKDRVHAWRLATDPATGRPRAEPIELPGDGKPLFRESPAGDIFDGGARWLAASREPRSSRLSWILGRFDSAAIESRDGFESGSDQPRVSADSRWLAWGNWHGKNATVVRLGSHDPPVALPMAGSVTVAFSPDSRLLAVGGPEEIRLYEVGTWRVLHSVRRHPIRPLPPHFAFMHGSPLCAAAQPPDEVLIFDTATGAELATLSAGPHILGQIAFSSDDRRLAAASNDHQVLMWDFEELRRELRDLGLDW